MISCLILKYRNWELLQQEMFNRMSQNDKISILEYVSDSKHQIILDEELR